MLKKLKNIFRIKKSDKSRTKIWLNSIINKLQDTNEKLQSENTRLQSENTRLQSENEKLKCENTGLQDSNTRLQGENTMVIDDIADLQIRYSDLYSYLTDIFCENIILKISLDTRDITISDKIGGVNVIDILEKLLFYYKMEFLKSFIDKYNSIPLSSITISYTNNISKLYKFIKSNIDLFADVTLIVNGETWYINREWQITLDNQKNKTTCVNNNQMIPEITNETNEITFDKEITNEIVFDKIIINQFPGIS